MMFHATLSQIQTVAAAWQPFPPDLGYGWRIIIILAIAVVSHLAVRLVRLLLKLFLGTRYGGRRRNKAITLAHFGTSALIFVLYFAACGAIFSALEIPLEAYFASATIIGIAVSFGAQGVIQDVITGLTLITSDLLDVGDMVEISGQTGIVRRIGVRFTVLQNYTSAEVFIPNRNVSNVINYQRGYIRAFLDAWLPDDESLADEATQRIKVVTQTIADQFDGLMLGDHDVIGAQQTEAGKRYIRIKFRIWPGQGGLIESIVRQAVLAEMKKLRPEYADWMVCVQYRVENQGVDT